MDNYVELKGKVLRPEVLTFQGPDNQIVNQKIRFTLMGRNSYKQENEFHNIEVIGKSHVKKLIEENIAGNDTVEISGRIEYDKWVNKNNGEKEQKTIIRVFEPNRLIILKTSRVKNPSEEEQTKEEPEKTAE